jgi:hypothetical protein
MGFEISALVFTFFIGILPFFKNEKLNGKDWIQIILSIAVFGATLISMFLSSADKEKDKSTIKNLKDNSDKMIADRVTDSTNNAAFQRYLKDTFGIGRYGNRPIITNITTINNVIKNFSLSDKKFSVDSVNVFLKTKGDIISVAPKEGTWAHAFFYVDSSLSKNNTNIVNEGMGPYYPYQSILINGKKSIYSRYIIDDRAVYLDYPMNINLSGAPQQYVIFGDQGYTGRRWLYKDGKVTWYPIK